MTALLLMLTLPVVLGGEDKYILDQTEKRITLNSFYAEFITKWLPSSSAEMDTLSLPIEIEVITKEEFLAALVERHEAIVLNVICWLCAMYYTRGKEYGRHDRDEKKIDLETAKRCAQVAEVLSWYNENFGKQMSALRDAFEKIQKRSDQEKAFTVDQFYAYVKEVSSALDNVNTVLITAKLKYKGVFKKILPHYLDRHEIKDKGEAYLREAWTRLSQALKGGSFCNMNMYMQNMLDEHGAQHCQPVPPSLNEFTAIWNVVQNAVLEKNYANVRNILSFENNCIRAKLTANNIQPPDNFGKRKWSLESPEQNDRTDYQFQFEEN